MFIFREEQLRPTKMFGRPRDWRGLKRGLLCYLPSLAADGTIQHAINSIPVLPTPKWPVSHVFLRYFPASFRFTSTFLFYDARSVPTAVVVEQAIIIIGRGGPIVRELSGLTALGMTYRPRISLDMPSEDFPPSRDYKSLRWLSDIAKRYVCIISNKHDSVIAPYGKSPRKS